MKSAALLLRAGLWIASAVAIVIGVARIVDENNERSSGVRVSRWLLLAGLVFPIWDLCTLWVNLALVVLQKSANTDSVLYVVLPMRHSLINISRWICYLAIWAGLVSGRPHRLDSLYLNVIRILTCIVLLWGARAVGIALTRVIAMQFYDKAYLRRMRDALEREFVIHFLILGARRTGRDKEKEKEKEKGRESEACRKRTGIKNR